MTTKERRALARANGQCGSCTVRPAETGKRSCASCLRSKHRTGETSSRRRGEIDEHICCQSHGEHRFDCAAATKRGAGPFLPRRES